MRRADALGKLHAFFARPSRMQTSVHPRMRGERSRASIMATRQIGSSPHARGTRPAGDICIGTPVHPRMRGEHVTRRIADSVETVHPRMRGEHALLKPESHDAIGSSPHARGTRRRCWQSDRRHAVHPRMRGEHSIAADCRQLARGSSPHARGTPRSQLTAQPLTVSVHPRMRGEHMRL